LWACTRRTDFPLMSAAPSSVYNGHNRPPFRYPYPTDEVNLNGNNIDSHMNGIVDHFWGQQMWWDTRTGVN
ncbi:MAG: SusD/RagB family nutrient-binding outer membrane lipoprotein, partial [Bacteroidales bacterium]|nr:SusD/RagB family nutrient-binding outer membrane lipoprotein [Bacteroidales bacterium]